MSEHVIDLDPLDPFSVLWAGIKYRRIVAEFNQKVDTFLEEIANLGRDTFDALGYTVDGGEITVTVEEIEDGYMINAAGKGIVFLEFGAGDTVNSGNKYASLMPFDVRPGSYSEINDHQYELTGRWVFGGVVYTEIAPRNGMQTAWETIMQNWRDIAERVFA